MKIAISRVAIAVLALVLTCGVNAEDDLPVPGYNAGRDLPGLSHGNDE